MAGELYIDGKNAMATYGIFVQEGGYAGTVEWPALKQVVFNDWPEEDGIDPDLTDPKLDGKEFSIQCCCVDAENIHSLFELLTDGAYHVFDFKPIGLVKTLRLISQPDVRTVLPLQTFTLSMGDDSPLEDYKYREPIPIDSCWQKGIQIDGRELSDYGVWILEGTLDEMVKAPAVKRNLSVNTSNIQGAIYEETHVRFHSKDVSLNCLLRAPSMDVFWNNYHALLYDLVRPGERLLYLTESEEYFGCYYKNSKVSRFAVIGDSEAWCEFTITLCFTSVRPGQTEYLLATEDDRLIITEEGYKGYDVYLNMKGYED